MAPWWLRTHKDEQLDSPSTSEGIDGDASVDLPSAPFEDNVTTATPSEGISGTPDVMPIDTPQGDVSSPNLRDDAIPAPEKDGAKAIDASPSHTASTRLPQANSEHSDPGQATKPRTAEKPSSIDGTPAAEPPAEKTSGQVAPAKAENSDHGGEAKPKRRRRRRRRKTGPETTAEKPAQENDTEVPTEASTVVPAATSALAATSDVPSTSLMTTLPQSPMAKSDRPPTSVTTESSTSSSSIPVERNYVFSFPERTSPSEERKLALFCDFENIALGVRSSEIQKLDMNLILARLLEKGKIIVKKAYADWERYNEYKRPLHESAIELIDIPQKFYSGKNSADIKLVVDAMDLCYSKEHLDTFVILSGDSDFSPLVSKLKENDKVVIGVGIKDSSSSLLVDNCDEFVFYEDIWKAAQTRPILDNLPAQKAEVFGLMADAMLALLRENKEVLWGSLVKQTMQRKSPSFNEGYYGYGSFSELLEDAERHRVIGLRKDQRSGNYVVTGFVN